MDEIRKEDNKLWLKEALAFRRLLWTGLALFLIGLWTGPHMLPLWAGLGLAGAVIGLHAFLSHQASIHRRFRNPRFAGLHRGCTERLARFDEVVGRLKKTQTSDLNEMPRTIRKVGQSLYLALRRADMISDEVLETERGILMQPPVWQANPQDHHARELYRMADKNIAEYRQQYSGVMAGVARVEAQAAVYMTTLDSIRMKLIGYSLTGRNPELSQEDFLSAIGEAKMQLHAIDKALEELDFRSLETPASEPPPFEDLYNRLEH